jgi:hypothetical protein
MWKTFNKIKIKMESFLNSLEQLLMLQISLTFNFEDGIFAFLIKANL